MKFDLTTQNFFFKKKNYQKNNRKEATLKFITLFLKSSKQKNFTQGFPVSRRGNGNNRIMNNNHGTKERKYVNLQRNFSKKFRK